MDNIRVNIVEDEIKQAELLRSYLIKYGQEKNLAFEISMFSNADDFIEAYKTSEILFMDIMMPGMNGMDAAHKLRALDEGVQIIFVTNMAQFAIKGYEVNAFDFIVKPVNYNEFSFKMDRVIKAVKKSLSYIIIDSKKEMRRLCIEELYYVEVDGHKLNYVTSQGTFTIRKSMKEVENELTSVGLLRCNNCYLVNPAHIIYTKGYDVNVNGTILQISHPRKKQFAADLAKYYATGGTTL